MPRPSQQWQGSYSRLQALLCIMIRSCLVHPTVPSVGKTYRILELQVPSSLQFTTIYEIKQLTLSHYSTAMGRVQYVIVIQETNCFLFA